MRKKRSKILNAVHETARGLHEAEAIDQVMMREFDQLCPKPASTGHSSCHCNHSGRIPSFTKKKANAW